jgi:hypothetical protein
VERHDFETLAARLEGPVLMPGQQGFDEERTGFNLAVRHRPEVIVGAVRADDVAAAVALAAEHDLPVAVQNTGHGFSAAAEGGLLVTTRRMAAVRVGRETRSAYVEAGARFEQLIPEAARRGLAPLNGSAPHVGVVSYTLGEGLALLGRRHGWAPVGHVDELEPGLRGAGPVQPGVDEAGLGAHERGALLPAGDESQEAWQAATADSEFRKRTRAAQGDPQTQITSSPGLYDVAVELIRSV